MPRRPSLYLGCAAIWLVTATAFAGTASLEINSDPAGAKVEWNGQLLGVTPFSRPEDEGFFKRPKFVWSRHLDTAVTLHVWKEGYLPKDVVITSGPYFFAGKSNMPYYVLNSRTVTVALERDPASSASVDAPSNHVAKEHGGVSGTGFLLGSGYVATNFHVVRDATRIEVRVPSTDKRVPARVVLKDVNNDLAILRGDDLPAPQARITFADPSAVRVGQDAFALGFPLGALMGTSVRLSTGTIDSLAGLQDDPRLYQISNPLQPGNSGGPLFNKDGQLVGIVVSQLDAKLLYEAIGVIPQNINFAVKSTYLRALIEMLPDGEPITKPQGNSLSGLPRDKQVEALTPAVVEITAER